MQNILFRNNQKIQADVKKLAENMVRITTVSTPNLSGFNLVNSDGIAYGRYEDFTTLYQQGDGWYILSNDGSVYVEPEPMPEPESVEKTLEEVQEMKVSEMNAAQQETIRNGVDVTLTDGTVEHFTLTDHDQTSLMGLQTRVAAGDEQIPWHTSDQSEGCKYYSNADMALITTKAMEFVTYHVTLFRDLRIYIRALTEIADVEAIFYGTYIPEEYQSQVLKDMLALMS